MSAEEVPAATKKIWTRVVCVRASPRVRADGLLWARGATAVSVKAHASYAARLGLVVAANALTLSKERW